MVARATQTSQTDSVVQNCTREPRGGRLKKTSATISLELIEHVVGPAGCELTGLLAVHARCVGAASWRGGSGLALG